jgi:hypothetical protein
MEALGKGKSKTRKRKESKMSQEKHANKINDAAPAWINGQPVIEVALLGEPPLAREIFKTLKEAGFEQAAIFGGAARDADCSAAWGTVVPIRDYDVRVWMPAGMTEFEAVGRVERAFGVSSRAEASLGTGRPRCCFEIDGVEIDLSLRHAPESATDGPAAAAIDRALDSDAAISSIAIDPGMRAWARPEYLEDRDGGTLSFFPIDVPEREAAYMGKMAKKFPGRPVRRVERFASVDAGEALTQGQASEPAAVGLDESGAARRQPRP